VDAEGWKFMAVWLGLWTFWGKFITQVMKEKL
jgi:hypothetical protein